jgi:hypothetical protein
METLGQAVKDGDGRKGNRPPIVEWGIASSTLAGEAQSGDRHLVKIESGFALVVAVDGLGHGEKAAEAAQTVIRVLGDSSDRSVLALLNRCHERLQFARGVAMSMAVFNATDRTMTWVGVGNVEGVLLRADPHIIPRYEALLLRSGVVGARMPLADAAIVPVMRGDTLVFATDGVRSDFWHKMTAERQPQQMAACILEQYRKGTDDALVLVARYIGGAP